MSNRKKYNLKKIDSVSALLWIFILFIIVLFVYLSKIGNNIQEFSLYNNRVNNLRIINKDLNNFLLRQATFINYDIINKKITEFDETVEFLGSKQSPYVLSHLYHELLKDVAEANKQKVVSIEYFKSQSSQLLYSMHYLYDLNSVIVKEADRNVD